MVNSQITLGTHQIIPARLVAMGLQASHIHVKGTNVDAGTGDHAGQPANNLLLTPMPETEIIIQHPKRRSFSNSVMV